MSVAAFTTPAGPRLLVKSLDEASTRTLAPPAFTALDDPFDLLGVLGGVPVA